VASVLSDGLLYVFLRTFEPRDCWSYLILWLSLTWVHFTWPFGGRPHAFTRNVVHFIQDMTHVMQSVGSHDDLAHSNIFSHI
jgi:hypothetical protein